MADPAAALATQLRNIETRSGRTLAQLKALVAGSGLSKHGEIRALIQARTGLGFGDANTVAHLARQEGGGVPGAGGISTAAKPGPQDAVAADPLDAIYAGPKAPLRALHERLIEQIRPFGAFEIAPKQKNVSLRRKRQFALLGPATKDLLELGLNHKALPAHPRLKALAPGGMCQATLRFGRAEEIDAEMLGWLREAYEAAG